MRRTARRASAETTDTENTDMKTIRIQLDFSAPDQQLEADAALVAASLRLRKASRAALAARSSLVAADAALAIMGATPLNFSRAEHRLAYAERERLAARVDLREEEEEQAEREWELAVAAVEELA